MILKPIGGGDVMLSFLGRPPLRLLDPVCGAVELTTGVVADLVIGDSTGILSFFSDAALQSALQNK